MRVLISNDDGIDAPGIQSLARTIAQTGAEVVVVAPDEQRSASSHGITLHRRLYATQVNLPSMPGIETWKLNGTPVDCVKWGIVMHGRHRPFDLMLSGLNEGSNLATDVLYSGTVAAAGEAALQGLPALALSVVEPNFAYEDAAVVACDMASWLASVKLPADTFLSVNFPADPLNKKWVNTRLGARSYKNDFVVDVDAEGRTYYTHTGELLEELGGDDTDVAVIRRGHISITPLQYHFTNDSFLDSLKTRITRGHPRFGR